MLAESSERAFVFGGLGACCEPSGVKFFNLVFVLQNILCSVLKFIELVFLNLFGLLRFCREVLKSSDIILRLVLRQLLVCGFLEENSGNSSAFVRAADSTFVDRHSVIHKIFIHSLHF